MRSTVISLTKNLTHQHSKVRKITLRGLQDIIVSRGAESFIEEALEQLKYSQNDRSQDVRQTFYTVLQHWMTHMELTSLRLFEAPFVLFLLNGVADDIKEISQSCIKFLEDHGKRMREALKAIGEEDDEEMKTDNEGS